MPTALVDKVRDGHAIERGEVDPLYTDGIEEALRGVAAQARS